MINNNNIKKTYYSISEVCVDTGLEQHVLRYWETEFPQLKPKKNRAGNRAYRQKDIKLIKFIKNLLYKEHYTIVGAKKRVAESNNYELETQMRFPLSSDSDNLDKKMTAIKEIRENLKSVLNILKQ